MLCSLPLYIIRHYIFYLPPYKADNKEIDYHFRSFTLCCFHHLTTARQGVIFVISVVLINMEKYKYPKEYPCSPSFSSTLLGSIYHSIDQAGKEKKPRNFNSSTSSSSYGLNNGPKPIRTSISTKQEKFDHKHQHPRGLNFYDFSLAKEKAKQHEDGFKKTKSRAMKIYRGLKKVKQPISPGGRLSTFFNSLFTNGRKTKISSHDHEERKLSKNIISGPRGHKSLDIGQQNIEARKGTNRNYIHEVKFHKNIEMFEEDEDEDGSCTSSDLFELDNFSSIGLMELHVL
ncbi:protein BIG GRAIN 1-like B [Capsicum annuum]|nr:protein BIG GRAIN 1-like B [Capsicum annuum]